MSMPMTAYFLTALLGQLPTIEADGFSPEVQKEAIPGDAATQHQKKQQRQRRDSATLRSIHLYLDRSPRGRGGRKSGGIRKS